MKDIFRGVNLNGRVMIYARYLHALLLAKYPQYHWESFFKITEQLSQFNILVDEWGYCYKIFTFIKDDAEIIPPENKGELLHACRSMEDFSDKRHEALWELFETFYIEHSVEETDQLCEWVATFFRLASYQIEWESELQYNNDRVKRFCLNFGLEEKTERCDLCQELYCQQYCPVKQHKLHLETADMLIRLTNDLVKEGLSLPDITNIREQYKDDLGDEEYDPKPITKKTL